MDAVLNYHGFPIKVETESYNIRSSYRLNQTGTLNSFKINGTQYHFFSLSNFKSADREYKTARMGYYNVEYFSSYKRGDITLALLHSDGLFDETNFKTAEEGDIVYLRRLNPKAPYTEYYYRDIYQFKVKEPVIGYKKKTDFPPIDNNVNSPDYSVFESAIHSTNDSFTKVYYAKNFGDFVESWQIPDELSEYSFIDIDDIEEDNVEYSKEQFARIMTFICWKLHHIKKDILSVLAITEISLLKEFYASKIQLDQNPAITDQTIISFAEGYDTLPLIDKIIAELLHQWGVIKFDYKILINDFPNTFNAGSTYDEMLYYYNALNNFYESIRYSKEQLLFPTNTNGVPIDFDGDVITEAEDSARRVQYLLNLSTNAVQALPFSNRLNILKEFRVKIELTENEQRIVVRLMNSFDSEQDADPILDYFLELGNGKTTNFEDLYYKLDDARLERYTIINWFVDRQTNRKFFIYVLHKIWKKSKYEYTFVPTGGITNDLGNNAFGFFLLTGSNGGDQYMPKYDAEGNITSGAETFLEFHTIAPDGTNSYTTTQVSTSIGYEAGKPLEKHIVTINKYNETTYIRNISRRHGDPIHKVKKKEKFGEYHLYQPLSLLGYQPNLNLKVPNVDAIPAFLLYYSDEFDEIYDVDAAISFGIDVVVEIGLFFVFGGAGAIRHLKHIRQLTKFKHLKIVGSGQSATLQLVGVTANETMIAWKVLSGTTEVVSVTASVFMSFYTYKAAIEDDPAKNEVYQNIANVFMYMAIGTAVGSALSRVKATKVANDILENTPPSVINDFPDDVIDVLKSLKGRKLKAILNFGNKLENLGTSSTNLLGKFFASLDDLPELKDLFYRDFEKINDINIWNKLNDTNILSRWKQLAELNIAERVNLKILDDLDKVKAITRYYEKPSLRITLEGMTFERRWIYLSKRGIIDFIDLDLLALNPKGIDLHIAAFKRPNGASYLMTNYQVTRFIRYNNNPVLTSYLIELQKPVDWNQITNLYRKRVKVLDISNSELKAFSNRFIDDLPKGDSKAAKSARRIFKRANKLYMKSFKVSNSGTLIDDLDTSNINFISSKLDDVDKHLLGSNSPASQAFKNSFVNVKDPDLQKGYKWFSEAAYDVKNRFRGNDTEIKFIDWFLSNQWHRGNKFDIELESVLFACESCQRHLKMLIEFGRKNGKTINIKFYSHPEVFSLGDVRKNSK